MALGQTVLHVDPRVLSLSLINGGEEEGGERSGGEMERRAGVEVEEKGGRRERVELSGLA